MKVKMEVSSLGQLAELGKAFAAALQKPMIVVLKGDLGAGKTTFVKMVAAALGCFEEVTSPTFALLNTYHTPKFPIYHFDMYRLEGVEAARELGFDEYFDKSRLDGVVFVEWPENVEGLIGESDFEVEISKIDERKRLFVISPAKKEKQI